MSDDTVPATQAHPHTFRSIFRSSLVAVEEQFAARLGNSERLSKCRQLPEFPAAREEWLAASDVYVSNQGLSALTRDTASSDDGKTYVLDMIRKRGPAPDLLRNAAAVFFVAATEGDTRFFKDFTAAMRAHVRRKRSGPTQLAWCILTHWFGGLLWLMDNEAGSKALQQYLRMEHPNTRVSEAAYRRARARLGLKGYQTFTKSPPILGYYPKQNGYGYDEHWRTRLEPSMRDE